MEESHLALNGFDIIVIAVLLFSAVLALFRGFVREVLSLVAWVGSFALAYGFRDSATEFLSQYVENPTIAQFSAAVGVFVLAFVVISIINAYLMDLLRDFNMGALDKSLGFLFGLLRGGLIITLLHLGIARVLPAEEFPDWFQKAESRSLIERSSLALAALAPEYVEQVDQIKKDTEDAMLNSDQVLKLKEKISTDLADSFSPESLAPGLSSHEKDILKTVLRTQPPENVLETVQDLKRMGMAERSGKLLELVSEFRRDYSPAKRRRMGVTDSDLARLEQQLSLLSNGPSAGGMRRNIPVEKTITGAPAYNENQADEFDRLIEQVR